MNRLLFALISTALITACGKIQVQTDSPQEPSVLTAARAAMESQQEDRSRFRGAYANGDLMIDLYWGSDGDGKNCRQWDLVLSRVDGKLLEFRRTLFTEQHPNFPDSVKQEGNNIHILTRTFGSVDGARVKVADGIEVNISGSMATCESTSTNYKAVAFSVTAKTGKRLLNGGMRMLDRNHYLATYVR